MKTGRRARAGWALAFAAGAAGAALALWAPLPANRLASYPADTVLLDRRGVPLRVRLGYGEVDCRPIPLAQAGAWTVPALLAAEDRRFFRHPGVDPLAVLRAAVLNLAHRRIVSGASTLTTQVIKLVEPRPRSWAAKRREFAAALRLERRLSKPAILEQYLNRAPFGGNLTGVESASRAYFHKHARDLTLAESALLMGLPQAPSRLRPDRHPAAARRRQAWVLRRMEACGMITPEQARQALRQPAPVRRQAAAFAAPHFCDMLLGAGGLGGTVITTLDAELQARVEALLRARVAALAAQGVQGGAAVVLEVRTGAVRAMAGAPDFHDARRAGQVNGAIAPRSPGSALKPFVYALALDAGLVTPASRIGDVPLPLPAYEPRNFDATFSGPVSVREALTRSLNLPALVLTRRLGQARVVETLRRLGLSTLRRPAAWYGLGIAVGGGEVTLLDLANAYACLARLGEYRPARLLEGAPPEPARRLFSPAAAFLVAEILGDPARGLEADRAALLHAPRVAWKTGTSAGCRDAWTLAYNPEYVVGVWLGNPDGRASPALIGAAAAAPLALELFGSLYPRRAAPWFTEPAGLTSRLVCVRSGECPGPACAELVTDYAIPYVSPTTRCTIHRGAAAADSAVEHWPAGIARQLRRNGMADGGADPGPAAPPRILSPANGEVYQRFTPVAGIRQEVPLQAASAPGPLYWFANGVFLGETPADEALFWPLRPGRWTLTCADRAGRGDRVTVRVE